MLFDIKRNRNGNVVSIETRLTLPQSISYLFAIDKQYLAILIFFVAATT